MHKVSIITIDGASGTGKGTLAHHVATQLGFHLLDSGALYRVLALSAKLNSISLDNIDALTEHARQLPVEFKSLDNAKKPVAILLSEEDVTDALRIEACGEMASRVAALPEIRSALLSRQRDFAKEPGLVCDGRDMGTVVFPEATLKIYLEASPEIRANRRYYQLKEKGINVSLTQLVQELARRDERDSSRKTAPLLPAEDAVVIDTSGLTARQVLEQVLALWDNHSEY